jgi:hypothetical protein
MFCLVLPLEWWMPRARYQRLNDYVMFVIYSPLLFITAFLEMREAHAVRSNRRRRVEDDDVVEEWEQMASQCDFENDGWAKKVEATKPNVEVQGSIVETRKVGNEVRELRKLVEELLKREAERDGAK